MPDENTVLRWSAYEHEYIERSTDWYWALGIVAVSAAVISVLFGDFLFALLVLLAAFTLSLLAQTRPELARFEISRKGIRINDTLHRFDDILAFWVEEDHRSGPHLLVDTTKWLSPNLVIPLGDIDPAVVRSFLIERAEERHMKESPAHRILEFFGL